MDTSKLMALMAQKKASMQKTEKTVKVKPGKNRVRLLPGWRKGEEHIWFHDFGQHFIKDEADQIKAVYICTNATFESDCAVCNALASATRAAGNDDITETLEKAKASRTVLINALMLDSDEPNTPVILELKRGVFGQLVDIVSEWGGTPLDPAEGQEIIIQRDGKGLNTTYTATIGPKKVPVAPAVLSKLNDLDAYVKQESEEQQRRAIGAINAVAGVLPGAAGAASGAPRLAAAKNEVFDDVPDLDVDTKPTAKPTAKPADAALAEELDDLLGDLPS